MNLPYEVEIQPPSFVRKNGEVRTPNPVKFNSLDVTLVDNKDKRLCYVTISHFPKALLLWSGDEYDEVGDYTQAQAEAKVLELLGEDIKGGLENLFVIA
jgi:hypothetical protein